MTDPLLVTPVRERWFADMPSLGAVQANNNKDFIPQLRSKTSEAQLQEPMELQYLPADSQIDSNLRKSLEYLTTAVKICTSEERKAKIDAILTSAVEQCKKEVGCNELQPHAEYSDRKKRIRTLKEFLRR